MHYFDNYYNLIIDIIIKNLYFIFFIFKLIIIELIYFNYL